MHIKIPSPPEQPTRATQMFINLHVKDLQASMNFFASLGFTFNPHFTNDDAACMVLGENLFSMLLTEPTFRGFSPNEPCDTSKNTEVLTGIALANREAVDKIVQLAAANGGSIYNEPKDHGFMYQHGFRDLDGHVWEVFWLAPSA